MDDTSDILQATQAAQPATQPATQPTQQPATPPPEPQVQQDQPVQQTAQTPLTDVSFMSQPQAKAGAAPSLLDYGKQIWRSVGETDSDLLGAASWTARQLGASPDTVAHIEQMRADTDAYSKQIFSSMTPAGQQAASASLLEGGTKDANGQTTPSVGDVGLLHYAMMNGASFVPDALLAVLTPEITAPVGWKIAGEVGASITKAATTGGVFGTIQMGGAYNTLVKSVDDMPDDKYQAQNPAYAQMRASGMDEHAAKAQIVKQGMTQLGALQFGIGAITGAGAGHLLTGGAVGGAGRGLLSRLGLGSLQGGLDLGAQGGGGNAAQQLSSIQAGLQSKFDPSDLATAFASGALSGVVLGAGGAAIHPGAHAGPLPEHEETQEPGASTSTVDPATQSALNTQLSLDLTQAPPGATPGNTQGELFRNINEAQPQPAAAQQAVKPQTAPTATAPATQAATASPQAAAGPAQPRPSDGMKRQELLDALKTMPNQDPKVISRMKRADLATAYDKAQQPAPANTTVVQPELPQQPAQGELPVAQPAAPAPRSTGQIQREDGVGFNEAHRRQQAEIAAQTAVSPVAEAAAHVQPAATPVDEAAAQAEEPSAAQAEAGNYQKGHTNIGGLDVSIETPAGGVRRGVGPDGTPWEATMPAHYGYIRRTTGADGDHVDVALGPNAHQAEQHPVYVFDQKDPATGKFDEHKAYLGFDNPAAAMDAYDKSFSDGSGPMRRGAVTEMPFDQFKDWTQNGDTTKALKYKPTRSDQLRARRATQKAKLAQPGAPMRGDVATAQMAHPDLLTDESEPVDKQAQRQAALGNLADAGRKVQIVPLKKGQDVAPLINRVMRELTERIGKTDGSHDAVEEELNKFAQDHANQMLPQTRTRYYDVANRVLQLMTDRELPATGMAREAVREARTPAVYESEGAARKADLEAASSRDQDAARQEAIDNGEGGNRTTVVEDEGSDTSTQNLSGPGSEREPTKVVDKLPWWLNRVMQGQMTAAEADQAYGRGSKTKPRKYPTFGHYVDARIREAEEATSVEKLAASGRKSDQAKSAETKAEQSNLGLADKLREVKAQLDPVGEAAEREDPTPTAEPAPTEDKYGGKRPVDVLREKAAARKAGESLGRTDRGSYARVINDPRVNRPVDELLSDGRPRSVHDYLNAIAADPVVQQETPELAAMARRLRTLVRPSIEVHVGTTDPTDAGRYYPAGGGRIHLNPSSNIPRVETVLHETMHAVTSGYINSLPGDHADVSLLRTMHEELQDAAEAAAERGQLTPVAVEDINYALTNAHELHTMLMTNPYLQQLAADHIPSSQFKLRMQSLGYYMQAAKSVWSAFTAFVRKALGLKGVPTAGEASLLDHLMRPAQDLTDRAAEFNRRGPTDVADAASHAMPDLRGHAKDVLDRVDFGGMGDTARRIVLPGATTDAIVNRNRDILPQLDTYRSATEAVAARSKQFHDDYADTVSSLIKRVQGPDRDKLAQLMNDATIANVQLGKGADNSHLENTESLTKLQARFNALGKPAQGTYEALRDYYRKTYREERDAQLSGLVKTFMPNITDAQREMITKAARTKGGIEKLITDKPDDVANAFGSAWGESRKLIRGIGKVHDLGFVQGDYFPLRRFGDYVVRYGAKENEDYGVEMFERRSEAEARRAELTKQGADNVSQVLDKRQSKLRSILPDTTVVDELNQAMRNNPELSEHADEARQLLNSILLQHATHSQRARVSMRRRGVAGASTDIEKVLAKDFLATASRVGYLEHGSERYQALNDARRQADELKGPGQQIRAQAVINELEQRMPSGDDASGALTGITRRFSTLGFVQSLMSPSHMLTSSIEAHMNSTALLGARHGVMRSSLALAKALKDVSPALLAKGAKNTLQAVGKGLKSADWNLSNVARDRLIAAGANRANMMDLFNRLNAAGLIDHTMVKEMQRIANPGADISQGWWGKFMDMNSAGAHAVDVANKTSIAKAAYDLEMRKTGNHDAAARYAVETARQSMPNYNLANKARITTDKGVLGGFAGPLTQFKQYGIHMYSVMANLMHTSIQGASRAERMEARKAFAGILATHAMMAGSLTLIGDPLRWIGGAYDFATGADKPHDYENDVRRWITSAFGPELGEVIARGLPHAAGIDIHRRVGLANLLEPPDLNSFDKKGFAEAVASAMTGAAGEDATVMAGGISKMLHGDILGGLKDLVPRVFRDPMKAMALNNNGVTDSRGKTILPPEKIGKTGIAAQALGFQPSTVSEFREARYATLEAREDMRTQHEQLVQGWLQAKSSDDRAAAKQQIDTYNAANPTSRITVQQLLAARQRDKTTTQRETTVYGLRVPRKQATALQQAGSFANSP